MRPAQKMIEMRVICLKVVLPREHGAWGMLFAPLVIGMFSAGFNFYHVLLILAMLAAYLASNPLIQWCKNSKRNPNLLKWALGYGMAAAVLGIPVLFPYPKLILILLGTTLILLINIRFAVNKNERHLFNDFTAMAGLSLGGISSYYVGKGIIDSASFFLWLTCLLQFFGSALHVKTFIREKGNRTFKNAANWYHIFLIALPLLAAFAFPTVFPYKWLFLAYAGSVLRTWLTPFNSNVSAKKAGILEIFNTIWFVIIVSFVFR